MQRWSEREVQFLLDHYPSQGAAYCAEELGRTPNSVAWKASSLGLKLIPSMRAAIAIANNTERLAAHTYKVGPDLFDPPTTPETAYILGLLWADGYLNEKAGCAVRISTAQRPLYSVLASMNYENKSGGSATPALLRCPSELRQYWWRGYFDGDGCLYLHSRAEYLHLTVGSTYDQDWEFLGLLDGADAFTIKRKKTRWGSYSFARMSHRPSISHLLKQIYQNEPQIGFSRKGQKARAIVACHEQYGRNFRRHILAELEELNLVDTGFRS